MYLTNQDIKFKSFKDSIHGYIHIPSCIVREIIDTELFQRLHDIEQTGMRSLFPAATHDRFVHSLGTYHLGQYAFNCLKNNAMHIMKDEITNIGDYELKKVIGNVSCTLSDDIITLMWWDKYELLFSLACLLHDCAHTPFSHTFEKYYSLEKFVLSYDWLKDRNGFISDNADLILYNINSIEEIDRLLIESVNSVKFNDDYIDHNTFLFNKLRAKPHEVASSIMVKTEYFDEIIRIQNELLNDNVFVNIDSSKADEIHNNDTEFVIRSILGLKYTNLDMNNSVDYSIKNCIISLLNSNTLDVDNLEYIMRDAYTAGLEMGSFDYQKIFSSLSIMPVDVIDSDFNNKPVNGLWLSGTKLFNNKRYNYKLNHDDILTIKGMWNIKHTQYNESGISDPQESASIDWIEVTPQKAEKNKSNVIDASKIYSIGKLRGNIIPDFVLECNKSTLISGIYTGHISGKIFSVHDSPFNDSEIVRKEYELVYDKSCINLIQKAVDSRNYEQLWIYSNPKVLFQSNFLLHNLLRLSTRYLCCKLHSEETGFGTKKIEFTECNGCSYSRTHDPDKIIPIILGFKTIFNKNDISTLGFFRDIGYQFYRTSDSDIISLYKRIYHENLMLNDLKSDTINSRFNMLFSRQHYSSLWKTYYHYQTIINDLIAKEMTQTDLDGLIRKMLDPHYTSQEDYKVIEDTQIKSILEEKKILSPLIIKSKLIQKRIDRYNTFFKWTESEIKRLSDIIQFDNDSADNENLFYIYGDIDKSHEFKVDEISEIFEEINKSF